MDWSLPLCIAINHRIFSLDLMLYNKRACTVQQIAPGPDSRCCECTWQPIQPGRQRRESLLPASQHTAVLTQRPQAPLKHRTYPAGTPAQELSQGMFEAIGTPSQLTNPCRGHAHTFYGYQRRHDGTACCCCSGLRTRTTTRRYEYQNKRTSGRKVAADKQQNLEDLLAHLLR